MFCIAPNYVFEVLEIETPAIYCYGFINAKNIPFIVILFLAIILVIYLKMCQAGILIMGLLCHKIRKVYSQSNPDKLELNIED